MISSPRRLGSAAFAFFATAAFPYLAMGAPASPDDIRDIRGPIAFPPWWHWPLAIALAGAAALGVVLLLRWWRARTSRELSPLERARKALLVAEERAREGRSREWAEIVAETMRGALATRLGTDVLPQTTAELAQAAFTKPPLADDLDAPALLALLETCDLARFAKARLDGDALHASTAHAGEIVERLFAPPARHPAHAVPSAETVIS